MHEAEVKVKQICESLKKKKKITEKIQEKEEPPYQKIWKTGK